MLTRTYLSSINITYIWYVFTPQSRFLFSGFPPFLPERDGQICDCRGLWQARRDCKQPVRRWALRRAVPICHPTCCRSGGSSASSAAPRRRLPAGTPERPELERENRCINLNTVPKTCLFKSQIYIDGKTPAYCMRSSWKRLFNLAILSEFPWLTPDYSINLQELDKKQREFNHGTLCLFWDTPFTHSTCFKLTSPKQVLSFF